jgi:hypothetical protein
MIELLRSNDLVLMSYLETLFRDAGIPHLVVDQNMSVLDGSIGILPRRMLVAADRLEAARRIVRDAGLETELPAEKASRAS